MTTALLLIFGAVAGLLGYQVMRDHVAADVYLERYTALSEENQQLVEQYNRAVTRTAVTELVIADGHVTVNVRTADNRVEAHPIDADPAHPIYVDYVVKDGRLLIRRVFDSRSAPDDAGVIDSDLLNLDWNDPSIRHGQAIYRQLSDGRWIVTVSGDGALSLAKVDPATEVDLLPAPEIDQYDPVEETKRQLEDISPLDVFRRWFGKP